MQGLLKGRRARVAIGGLLAAFIGGASLAQAADYSTAPTPAWVERVALPPNPEIHDEQITNGAFHVLVDAQSRVAGRDRVNYRRFATRAINAAGVDAVANIAISFDPSYQTLVLHSIDVIRDGQVVSRLGSVPVKVLQREAGLEARIFDGRKSANVFLEDVRVGDTIDYSYSVRGSNPVFGNRAYGEFGLQFGEPVGRMHARLVYGGDRPVVVRARNSDLHGSVRDIAGAREYEWSADDVAPLLVEDDAPGWYDPYPVVEWSTFGDWAEVVRWALPLYAQHEGPGRELDQEIRRIAARNATPAARTMAALQFVQGEIRYLGVEIGPNSHAPNAPDLVLKRRFGDCKDKATLLVAMLDALGIEARPALVASRMQRAVAGRLPGPRAFDHVIVRARVDGKTYWLDATRPKQVGDLDHVFQPDFGRALVVDAATTDLVPMTNPASARSRTEVNATYDAREGFAGTIGYTVRTRSIGGMAESARERLLSQSAEDAQKGYLNFYARTFPGIKVAQSFEVDDNAGDNAIGVTEHYAIDNLSRATGAPHAFTTAFEFPDTESLLADPSSTVRHAPLFQLMPLDVTNTTEILLPMNANIKSHSWRVEDPAFTFERTVSTKGDRHILIADHFVSLADEIVPDDVARYTANLRKARESLGYALNWNDLEPGQGATIGEFNWMFGAFVALMTALWAFVAWLLNRWDPEPLAPPTGAAPVGLGGWLLVPMLALPVRLMMCLHPLYVGRMMFDRDTWRMFTVPDASHYNPLFASTAMLEVGANLALAMFMVLLAVQMFQRRTSLPRLLPISLWLQVVVLFGDAYLTAGQPEMDSTADTMHDATRAIIAAVIWTLYFATSARVRATFVRRRGASPMQEKIEPAAVAPVPAG